MNHGCPLGRGSLRHGEVGETDYHTRGPTRGRPIPITFGFETQTDLTW